jgi:hypothetical protein
VIRGWHQVRLRQRHLCRRWGQGLLLYSRLFSLWGRRREVGGLMLQEVRRQLEELGALRALVEEQLHFGHYLSGVGSCRWDSCPFSTFFSFPV